MLNVEYIDHCGFIVESDKAVYIFDYVEGRLPAKYLNSTKPVQFFITSADKNHYSEAVFSYRKPIFMSYDILASPFRNVFQVEPGDVVHLGYAKVHAHATTREGVFYVIEEADRTIVHGGDLNNWHWSMLSNQAQILEESLLFEEAYQVLDTYETIDLLMVAVDPRMEENYDLGARDIIKKYKPRYVIPMHFGKDAQDIQSFVEWTKQQKGTTFYIPKYTNQTFRIEG